MTQRAFDTNDDDFYSQLQEEDFLDYQRIGAPGVVIAFMRAGWWLYLAQRLVVDPLFIQGGRAVEAWRARADKYPRPLSSEHKADIDANPVHRMSRAGEDLIIQMEAREIDSTALCLLLECWRQTDLPLARAAVKRLYVILNEECWSEAWFRQVMREGLQGYEEEVYPEARDEYEESAGSDESLKPRPSETAKQLSAVMSNRDAAIHKLIADASADGRGMSGAEIIAEVEKRGHRLSQSTLTSHIIPRLVKRYGLRNNNDGAGYFYPQELPTDSAVNIGMRNGSR